MANDRTDLMQGSLELLILKTQELRFHLELLTEQHLQHADTLVKARASALRRFGNVEQFKDQCVEALIW